MSGSSPELAIARLTDEIDVLADALKHLSAFSDTERYLDLRRRITVLGVRRYYAMQDRLGLDVQPRATVSRH